MSDSGKSYDIYEERYLARCKALMVEPKYIIAGPFKVKMIDPHHRVLVDFKYHVATSGLNNQWLQRWENLP